MLNRPYKLPRRIKFKVMTGVFTEWWSGETNFYYTEVYAESPEDALSQCARVVTWCGETCVERIDI